MFTVAAAGANHAVQVSDSSFSPMTLTIQVGDTVTWSNSGILPHNVRADDGSFRSGTPSAADWTFTRTFNDPGMIRYYCEAHGAPGGIGMAGSITVEGSTEPPPPPPPGNAHVALIGVAGSVAGANNSFFQTSARLFNPSATDSIIVGGSYLKAGQDNRNATEVTIVLGPREVRIFDDIVGTLFGSDGLGGLRFHGDDPFEVTARVSSTSNCAAPPGGASGVLLTGISADDALSNGVLLHLEETAANRTNIGFVNPNETEVQITATLFGPDGQIGNPLSTSIAPRGAISPINLKPTFGASGLSEENLFVVFEATQPVFAYGTLVDNVTNDPTFTPARSLSTGGSSAATVQRGYGQHGH
ncbi:MAG: plastocyanin/azurin family copper-binding protein [Thermoanaerobaculia bacterium]